MVNNCCVLGCRSKVNRDNVKFFKFPLIRKNKLHDISKRRQKAWLKAIGRKDLEKINLMYMYVCEKHFINKKSADIKDEMNCDWVPSVDMGFEAPEEPASAQSASAWKQYRIAVNKSSTKIDLEKIEAPTRNTCDQFSQTEDLYIMESVSEPLLKKCEDQERQIKLLKVENVALKENHKKTTWNDLQGNDKKVKYLTGLPNFETMKIVFRKIVEHLPMSRSGKISKFDVFIITLIKMRLDIPFTYMSYEYGVTVKTLIILFRKTIQIMYDKLRNFPLFCNHLACLDKFMHGSDTTEVISLIEN